jgi:hypothetical protein
MPATLQDRSLVHGKLVESRDQMIVLGVLGTDYLLHLAVEAPLRVALGQRLAGRIDARARRVDVVTTGGRFIEPVYGRPRRLQGRILEVNATANTLTVQCACPFVCLLTANQRAGDFQPGQLVAFDVERGARFRVIAQKPVEDDAPDALISNGASIVPPGHLPTEGTQLPTEARMGGPKTTNHGALTDDRDVTGQEKPPADFPISGDK